jgi:hypothetical protein
MAKLRIFTVLLLLLGGLGAAHAESLEMDGMSQTNGVARPASGMTAANVEAKFGAPDAKVAPVGDPPISRWEYKDFVVYFEYDRVIHAVVRRNKSS